ncbi:MAG TPA: arabinogalactan endo-1,4-beta-galactosidase, partial [Amycolatopsis sp.]|nr:arabinogalactan endo-1,4-beta-galactosidase [Amycolatopsis sp.]
MTTHGTECPMNDRPEIVSPPLGRRSVLLGAAAGVGALAWGAGAATQAMAAVFPAQPAAAAFFKGADISWAPQMEARGYTWKNAGG